MRICVTIDGKTYKSNRLKNNGINNAAIDRIRNDLNGLNQFIMTLKDKSTFIIGKAAISKGVWIIK